MSSCWYEKKEKNIFHYFQMLFVLNILTINTVHSCILIWELVSVSWLFLLIPEKIILYYHADCLSTVLHWAIFFTKQKDRKRGNDKHREQ